MKAAEPSVIFFPPKYFETFYQTFYFQDYKTEMNLIKTDIFVFCSVFKNRRRQRQECELLLPTATQFADGSAAL